jgi:hypothetical protein
MSVTTTTLLSVAYLALVGLIYASSSRLPKSSATPVNIVCLIGLVFLTYFIVQSIEKSKSPPSSTAPPTTITTSSGTSDATATPTATTAIATSPVDECIPEGPESSSLAIRARGLGRDLKPCLPTAFPIPNTTAPINLLCGGISLFNSLSNDSYYVDPLFQNPEYKGDWVVKFTKDGIQNTKYTTIVHDDYYYVRGDNNYIVFSSLTLNDTSFFAEYGFIEELKGLYSFDKVTSTYTNEYGSTLQPKVCYDLMQTTPPITTPLPPMTTPPMTTPPMTTPPITTPLPPMTTPPMTTPPMTTQPITIPPMTPPMTTPPMMTTPPITTPSPLPGGQRNKECLTSLNSKIQNSLNYTTKWALKVGGNEIKVYTSASDALSGYLLDTESAATLYSYNVYPDTAIYTNPPIGSLDQGKDTLVVKDLTGKANIMLYDPSKQIYFNSTTTDYMYSVECPDTAIVMPTTSPVPTTPAPTTPAPTTPAPTPSCTKYNGLLQNSIDKSSIWFLKTDANPALTLYTQITNKLANTGVLIDVNANLPLYKFNYYVASSSGGVDTPDFVVVTLLSDNSKIYNLNYDSVTGKYVSLDGSVKLYAICGGFCICKDTEFCYENQCLPSQISISGTLFSGINGEKVTLSSQISNMLQIRKIFVVKNTLLMPTVTTISANYVSFIVPLINAGTYSLKYQDDKNRYNDLNGVTLQVNAVTITSFDSPFASKGKKMIINANGGGLLVQNYSVDIYNKSTNAYVYSVPTVDIISNTSTSLSFILNDTSSLLTFNNNYFIRITNLLDSTRNTYLSVTPELSFQYIDVVLTKKSINITNLTLTNPTTYQSLFSCPNTSASYRLSIFKSMLYGSSRNNFTLNISGSSSTISEPLYYGSKVTIETVPACPLDKIGSQNLVSAFQDPDDGTASSIFPSYEIGIVGNMTPLVTKYSVWQIVKPYDGRSVDTTSWDAPVLTEVIRAGVPVSFRTKIEANSGGGTSKKSNPTKTGFYYITGFGNQYLSVIAVRGPDTPFTVAPPSATTPATGGSSALYNSQAWWSINNVVQSIPTVIVQSTPNVLKM